MSKGNVTHWLTAGHIDGAALVGEGRMAKIDVELAMAQLQERLSVDERFGLNGLNTNLEPPAPAPEPKTGPQERAPQVRVIPEGETEGTVEAKLKAENASVWFSVSRSGGSMRCHSLRPSQPGFAIKLLVWPQGRVREPTGAP